MLSPNQQALDLLQKSKNILIALPETLGGDSLGSALALQQALKKLNKNIEIVSQEEIPEKLKFLPGIENLKNKVSSWRDFIISVDTSQNKISRLRYEKENNTLKIFLASPQKIEQKDIRLESGSFYYDLIIALDCPDLDNLGRTFSENTELFFNRPILNIDHKSSNEYYGEVNLVEPTAAACAEIVIGLIESLGLSLIDERAATALLTGLIDKTRSFQNIKTTPQALNMASLLIIKGADQEMIIRNLYKTKSLNLLKLWGNLLSRIDYDERKKLIWLSATNEDFAKTQTSNKDLPLILEEICDNFPQTNFCFIVWRENGSSWVLSQAKQIEMLQRLNLDFPGTIKNGKWLAKISEQEPEAVKSKINALLNSLQ